MRLKRNTAATIPFTLISSGDGETPITSGSPSGYYCQDDGTQAALDTPNFTHRGNGQWTVDLIQSELDADAIDLLIVLAGAISVVRSIDTYTLTDYHANVSGLATAADLAIVDAIVDLLITRCSEARLAKLDVTGALAHSDAADTYKATLSAVAAIVWDALAGDHVTASTMGALINLCSRIGSGTIAVSSPVAITGDVSIVQGDSYASADSRALTWTTTSYAGPDVAGASIMFRVIPLVRYDSGAGEAVLEQAGTVAVAAGTLTVTVELTSAQTAELAVKPHKYELEITLTSGRIYTYALGDLIVARDITPES